MNKIFNSLILCNINREGLAINTTGLIFYRNKYTVRVLGQHSAFTLAEVLITLMVIGVVAAMTIPGFISEHQKQTYIAGLKKAYAESNQALQTTAYKYCGSSDISCLFSTPLSYSNIGNSISSSYNVVKNCKNTQTGCFGTHAWDYTGTTPNTYNETGSYYNFTVASDMSISLKNFQANCGLDTSYTPGSPTEKVCGELWVDVNGKKGPNAIGRDSFQFLITSNKNVLLYPFGGKECNPNNDGDENGGGSWWNVRDSGRCGVSTSYFRGFMCAGRIMEENWQMNY